MKMYVQSFTASSWTLELCGIVLDIWNTSFFGLDIAVSFFEYWHIGSQDLVAYVYISVSECRLTFWTLLLGSGWARFLLIKPQSAEYYKWDIGLYTSIN